MQKIGVIGAGTMGGGVAQLAAQSGLEVVLYDVAELQLQQARGSMRSHWRRGVEKGRMTEEAARLAEQHLQTATDLHALADMDVVIEAAPERLELKQQLFRDLEGMVGPDAILATNTSSLSVSAVAGGLKRPERVVGMHFFNPAPIMPLVEVVAGHVSAAPALERIVQLARMMGKTPVRAQDTPGFIVNRVARPFYLEALRLVGAGVASQAQVDRIMRSGGFKQGPFELMDMIGLDINLAVSRSVFEQFFGEPRFRPHPLQVRLVQCGRLGRKTRQGFYRYDEQGRVLEEGGQAPGQRLARVAPPSADRSRILVVGREDEVQPWLQACMEAGYAVTVLPERGRGGYTLPEREPRESPLRAAADAFLCLDLSHLERPARRELLMQLDTVLPPEVLLLSDATIYTTTELASWIRGSERLVGMGALAPAPGALQVAVGQQTSPEACQRAMDFLGSLGFSGVETVQDGPGLVFGRILACIINEAALALEEGVATAADIDTAMRLGTGYPYGPLAWGDMVGLDLVLAILETLRVEAGGQYASVSHLLRQLVRAGYTGKAAGRGFYRYDLAER